MKYVLATLLMAVSFSASALTVKCSNGKTYTGATSQEVIKKATKGKNYFALTDAVDGKVTALKIRTTKSKAVTTCNLK